MFYCEKCRVKNKWPLSPGFRSFGPCEVCQKTLPCYDVPSGALPVRPRPDPKTFALNAMLRCYDYGKSTTPKEWEAAAKLARKALK